MATVVPCSEKIISVYNNNLEIYSLVWLDQSINENEELHKAQIKLKSVINYIQIFDCIDKCEKFIVVSKEDRIILIINKTIENEIIPRIYNLDHVISIYMYYDIDQKIEPISKISKSKV